MLIAAIARRRAAYRFRIFGLVAGLVSLLLLTVAFTLAIVQVQATLAAYLGGESIWSRGQLTAVRHLEEYARTGDPVALAQSRQWLRLPLANMTARRAMEAPEPDFRTARQKLVEGGNAPEDVSAMVWLYRLLSGVGDFRRAAEAWRATDEALLEIGAIADRLEKAWAEPADPLKAVRVRALDRRLQEANAFLAMQAGQFRQAMADTARWVSKGLTIASVCFLAITGFFAWLLGGRLSGLMRRQERKFRAIFEQAAVGIAQVTWNGELLRVNQALCDILDLSSSRLAGRQLEAMVFPEDRPLARQQHLQIAEEGRQSYTTELRLQPGPDSPVWVRLTVSAVREGPLSEHYCIVVVEDISEAKRMASELIWQANHDQLTGLMNRRAFEGHLAELLARSRQENSSHAVCFIDLDRFKLVNDTSGHRAGDELLQQVADLARNALRQDDHIARLGGDEFGVILEYCDLDSARDIADKLRKSLESFVFTWEGLDHSIGCSIGVVPVTSRHSTITEVLRTADTACYMAKGQGRNRVCVLPEGGIQGVDVDRQS